MFSSVVGVSKALRGTGSSRQATLEPIAGESGALSAWGTRSATRGTGGEGEGDAEGSAGRLRELFCGRMGNCFCFLHE